MLLALPLLVLLASPSTSHPITPSSSSLAPQLDERTLAELVRNPAALRIVVEFLDSERRRREQQEREEERRRRKIVKDIWRRKDVKKDKKKKDKKASPAPIFRTPAQQKQKQQQQQQPDTVSERKDVDFFGFLQRHLIPPQQQKKKKKTNNIPRPRPPATLPANNPLVRGELDPAADLDFFGPSDHRPDSPYSPPWEQQQHKKKKQPQVLPWQVGYIPIPR